MGRRKRKKEMQTDEEEERNKPNHKFQKHHLNLIFQSWKSRFCDLGTGIYGLRKRTNMYCEKRRVG